MKITLIAPYEGLAYEAQQVCRAYAERIEIVCGTHQHGVQLGQKAIRDGAWVLISRGGTWRKLCEELSVPVVEIAVTPYDVLRALQKVRHKGTRFAVVGSTQVIGGLTSWCSMLNVPIFPIATDESGEETRSRIAHVIQKDGVDCLLGDVKAIEYSAEFGIPKVLIESGKESIWAAIQEAKRIVAAYHKSAAAVEHSAFDEMGHGVLLVENGVVQFANRTVLNVVGMESIVGMHASVCLPADLQKFVLAKAQKRVSADIILLGGRLWSVESTDLAGEDRHFITLRSFDEGETIRVLNRRNDEGTGHVALHTFEDLVGSSQEMRSLIEKAHRFARADANVLIVGETGTGKELLAQSIHNASSRERGPFVAVNCSGLPEQLLESELFGYNPGAFTGALRAGKPGLFEIANGGTVFLDEIADAPLSVQQRLLRVVQERQVMRVGGERPITIDVRIVAATNKSLWKRVDEGQFREDLLFRLDVLRLDTVPLRCRLEDTPELLDKTLHRLWYRRKGIGARPQVHPEVYSLLQQYHWPGNVRELENMVEYLISMFDNRRIDGQAVREWLANKGQRVASEPPRSGGDTVPEGTLDDIERKVIEQTLHRVAGDMGKAAEELGISRTTLWRKLKSWQTVHRTDNTDFAH